MVMMLDTAAACRLTILTILLIDLWFGRLNVMIT